VDNNRPTPPIEEVKIGLETYMTDSAPLGGKLRTVPEDFQVNEISIPPNTDPKGPYTIARIKVYNWETNRLIRAFSKRLGISRKKIGFAGTKDKRAITTQYFSFDCPEESVRNIGLKDVFVLDTYRSNKNIDLGDLQGNAFSITVRGIEKQEKDIKETTNECVSMIQEYGGFPNFFGVQRFGSIRPITHIIGRNIIDGDFELAVINYICNPGLFENTVGYEARTRLYKEKDFKAALDYYPNDYIFERSMISHLAQHQDDWIGALEQLPDNLKMMFVHAYQSFIFNRILSERMKRGLPIDEPIEGDVVIPLNKNLLPDHRSYIIVSGKEQDHIREMVKRRKAFVSGIVIGYEPFLAEGEMGEIERMIIASEKIDVKNFYINDLSSVSSRGIRRELLAMIFDLRWRNQRSPRLSNDSKSGIEDILELKFSLFKGSYATSFLREIMKTNILDY